MSALECTGQITALHSNKRGYKKSGKGSCRSGNEVPTTQIGSEICLQGVSKRETELMTLEFYCGICQKYFTH